MRTVDLDEALSSSRQAATTGQSSSDNEGQQPQLLRSLEYVDDEPMPWIMQNGKHALDFDLPEWTSSVCPVDCHQIRTFATPERSVVSRLGDWIAEVGKGAVFRMQVMMSRPHPSPNAKDVEETEAEADAPAQASSQGPRAPPAAVLEQDDTVLHSIPESGPHESGRSSQTSQNRKAILVKPEEWKVTIMQWISMLKLPGYMLHLESCEHEVVHLTIQGHRILALCSDDTARVLDVRTAKEVHKVERPGIGWAASFWQGLVACAADDRVLWVQDLVTGGCLATMRGHEATVGAIVMREHHVISGDAEGAVRLWDLRKSAVPKSLSDRLQAASKEELANMAMEWGVQCAGLGQKVHSQGVQATAISEDCRIGLSAANDGTIFVFSVPKSIPAIEQELAGFKIIGSRQALLAVSVSLIPSTDTAADRMWWLASGDAEGWVSVWRIIDRNHSNGRDGKERSTANRSIQPETNEDRKDDEASETTSHQKPTFKIIGGEENVPFEIDFCWRRKRREGGSIWSLALFAGTVVCGDSKGTVTVCDLISGKVVKTVEVFSGVGVSALSVRRGVITAGSYDGQVAVWESGTSALIGSNPVDTGKLRG